MNFFVALHRFRAIKYEINQVCSFKQIAHFRQNLMFMTTLTALLPFPQAEY